MVILSGIKRSSADWKMIKEWAGGISNLRDFYLLDTAIEWAEDQIVYRYGGSIDFHETTDRNHNQNADHENDRVFFENGVF